MNLELLLLDRYKLCCLVLLQAFVVRIGSLVSVCSFRDYLFIFLLLLITAYYFID